MKKIRIKNLNPAHVKNAIFINGKEVSLNKVKNGVRDAYIELDDDVLEVSILKQSELLSPLWLLLGLIKFIVSIFGIFEPKKEKGILSVRCNFTINATNCDVVNLDYRSHALKATYRAFDIKCNAPVNVIENEYYEDPLLKKRRNVLRFCKALTFVLFAIVIIASII